MAQPQLDDALEKLVGAELIFRRGTPPNAEYTFKHALVQEAAYHSLLRSKRREYHGQIARVLEKQFPEIATSPAASPSSPLDRGGSQRTSNSILAKGRSESCGTVGKR